MHGQVIHYALSRVFQFVSSVRISLRARHPASERTLDRPSLKKIRSIEFFNSPSYNLLFLVSKSSLKIEEACTISFANMKMLLGFMGEATSVSKIVSRYLRTYNKKNCQNGGAVTEKNTGHMWAPRRCHNSSRTA